MLAKVTIIGRPNVGKSSFFNMFTGHRIAIVDDEAGTTRDISEYEFFDEKNDLTYILADSGGLDFGSKDDEVAEDIVERTETAIKDSDLLIWIIEYDKFTELDARISHMIRKYKADNFLVVANKADNEDMILQSYSAAGKGELEFFPISTSHNKGIADIKRFVSKYLTSRGLNYKIEQELEGSIKLALLGRPNVGKSSLINALCGKDRAMVKDQSGTTRDSIDTKFNHKGEDFTLIDTAGIRRLSRVGTRNVENWSIMRSDRAMKRADIIGVVVDGFDGIVQQDLSIISRVIEEKKGLIIIVNKWDLVLDKNATKNSKSKHLELGEDGKADDKLEADKAYMMDRYIAYLQEKIEFLPWVSVIFTSATDKKRVDEILARAVEIHAERQKRVKTSIVNNFLEQVVYKHAPTGNKKSHSPKIYYGTQAAVNPPKFVFTVSNPDHFHFSYKRYLENKIRMNFGFEGTPMIIEYRGRGKHAGKVK